MIVHTATGSPMRVIALLVVFLFVLGCGDSSGEEGPSFQEEFVAGEVPSPSGKDDEVTYSVESLDFEVPEVVLGDELRRTMTSEDAFQRVFGAQSPGVDWEENWVIFYTTGPLLSRENDATIETVRLAESEKSLQVVTRHSHLDRACQINYGPSRYEMDSESPYALVTIPRPSVDPRAVRYYADDVQRPCADNGCRDELAPVEDASDGLLFMSEGDYPFEPVYLPELDFEDLEGELEETYGDLTTSDYDSFMDWRTRAEDWMTQYQRDAADQYRKVDEAFREQFTDLRVYRAGRVEIHIFIVGVTSCGHVGGLRTISIQT